MDDQNLVDGKEPQEQPQESIQIETKSIPNQLNKKKSTPKKKKSRLARSKKKKALEKLKDTQMEDILNIIPSFSMLQYNFKSLFSIELNSFLITLAFIAVLGFSSDLGLYLPSRFEITSLNTTLKVGFFEKTTIFYPNFYFKRKHSKFTFYYQLKKKEDPFGLLNPDEKNLIEIQIKLVTNQSTKMVKKFNTTILKYSDIDVQPLFDIILDQPTDQINLKIKFLGDMTNYKTFFIKSVVYNTTYLHFLKYYRVLFSIIGLFFIFHSFFSFLNFSNIQNVGFIIIIVNFPSIAFDIEKSTFGYIIQTIADHLFTQFLLTTWVYHKCQQIQKKRPPMYHPNDYFIFQTFFGIFILFEIGQMINIIDTSISEAKNIYNYLDDDPQGSDIRFLLNSAFLIFVAYFINTLNTGTMRVSVANFFFFAAQACAFCDSLIERCRVVKCIGMVKWMRMFTEPVSLFFLVVLFSNEESDLSERVMTAIPLNFEDESSLSRKGSGFD